MSSTLNQDTATFQTLLFLHSAIRSPFLSAPPLFQYMSQADIQCGRGYRHARADPKVLVQQTHLPRFLAAQLAAATTLTNGGTESHRLGREQDHVDFETGKKHPCAQMAQPDTSCNANPVDFHMIGCRCSSLSFTLLQ